MKLMVLGIGDCGSKLAGEFSELNKKARAERRVQIVTNAYAINNDQPKLASLKTTYRELQTIYVGRTFEGDKTAKAGADIMRDEGNRVLTSVKPSDFYNTHAILLIAGAAGYFGSGGIPVMAQLLRDRHIGKPVYALIVLPFESEIVDPKCVVNTAVCLKSIQQVTEAVFLVDNKKYRGDGHDSANTDTSVINKAIVSPYYDILCASEHVDPKSIGARTLGVGDMMQALHGWTAIGMGSTDFEGSLKTFWRSTPSFKEKGTETQKAIEAMSLALGKLSIDINLTDSHKAVYLLSIPAESANVNMVKAVSNRLLDLTNNAEIRGGDFYGVKNCAQITLIISSLSYVAAIKNYYDQAISITKPPPEPLSEPVEPEKITKRQKKKKP
jgi:cell division GTPase FtsZ